MNARGVRIGLFSGLIALLCACVNPTSSTQPPPLSPPAPSPSPTVNVLRYAPSTENFANPERGFYQQESPLWLKAERQPLNPDALKQLRTEGVSTLRLYLMLDADRDRDIPTATLEYLGAEFAKARAAGLKVIPRFAYAYPQGGSFPYKEPDAPITRVLGHIAQLQPLLRDNADIISFVEAGFVGAWGEWHSSTNQLVDAQGRVTDASRAIVARLLEALPPERMIALRYVGHKQAMYGDAPLTAAEAHSASARARIGAHNDCFLASDTDWGTYAENATTREGQKAFLAQDNRALPQGGETCNNDASAQPYTGCDNAGRELQRLHYSALNRGYLEDVYARWDEEGCLQTVKQRLGYRFALSQASLPVKLRPNEALRVTLTVRNEGYAAPFNPRGVALVLRATSGTLTRLTVTDGSSLPTNRALDPRFWMPSETTVAPLEVTLPSTLEPGAYEVLLHLFDPMPALRDRPEYAVRLANDKVWDAGLGMNRLGTLEVAR